MKQKKNFRFYLLVSLATLLPLSVYNTNAANAVGTEAAGVKQGDQEINWLFVVTGTSGSFDGKTITLHNIPPILMFSDRPHRFFGHMDPAKLIKEVTPVLTISEKTRRMPYCRLSEVGCPPQEPWSSMELPSQGRQSLFS